MAQQTTRVQEQTMTEAVDQITDLPGVTAGTVQGVWATFNCDDATQFTGAVESAMKKRGVVLHKADRQDGFVSIALEEFAGDL